MIFEEPTVSIFCNHNGKLSVFYTIYSMLRNMVFMRLVSLFFCHLSMYCVEVLESLFGIQCCIVSHNKLPASVTCLQLLTG